MKGPGKAALYKFLGQSDSVSAGAEPSSGLPLLDFYLEFLQ